MSGANGEPRSQLQKGWPVEDEPPHWHLPHRRWPQLVDYSAAPRTCGSRARPGLPVGKELQCRICWIAAVCIGSAALLRPKQLPRPDLAALRRCRARRPSLNPVSSVEGSISSPAPHSQRSPIGKWRPLARQRRWDVIARLPHEILVFVHQAPLAPERIQADAVIERYCSGKLSARFGLRSKCDLAGECSILGSRQWATRHRRASRPTR